MSTTASRFRWLCKKGARRAVANGSAAIAKFSRHPVKPGIRVLTYHRFGDATRDPFCVGADDFEKQMKFLAERKLAVSLSQMIDFANGKKSIDETQVMVTIDDGLVSTCSIALPILRHFDIPAVAFISPGLIEAQIETGLHNGTDEPYAEWEQIGALARDKVAIGSHALSHRSLGDMTAVELSDEVERSKELIERRVGETVLSFAYPYGTYADFNQRTAAAIRRAGYACAFTSQHGLVQAGANLLELPRVKVEGGEDLGMYRRIVAGGLDAWRFIDRALWQLQARGA